jgi:hypothetical protein
MKKLIKDSENNVMELISLNGSIPPGYTEVAAEEVAAEELNLARRNKMAEIRARRNAMLQKNDVAFLIAQKTSASTTAIKADANILRDLPEAAQTEIDGLESVESIRDFDAFAELELSQDYE